MTRLLSCVALLYLAVWIRGGETIQISDPEVSLLRDLDIVLVRGQTLRSRLVRAVNFSSEDYSHVGIILKGDDAARVLHVTPAGDGNNGLRFDPIQEFLELSHSDGFAILRLRNAKWSTEIKRRARAMLSHQIPFDYHFDNLDSSRLYCSELIVNLISPAIELTLDLEELIHPNDFLRESGFQLVRSRSI